MVEGVSGQTVLPSRSLAGHARDQEGCRDYNLAGRYLRHTSISHYFRQTGSYGKTAEFHGNSESIIKAHYQGRVTSAETKQFYALLSRREAGSEHDHPPALWHVELAVALKYNWHGYHLSEKMDGVWCLREIAGSLLAGERMRDGRFYVFDIPVVSGQDISREPLRFRLKVLADFIREHPEVLPVPTGSGGEFLAAVLGRGGEGIVAKPYNAAFGVGWCKVKRFETHDVLVTELQPAEAKHPPG